MSRFNELFAPGVIDYVLDNSLREPEILTRLRAETAALPNANMQIPEEEGQLLQVLVRMTGTRRALEVGVFTGYSSLAVALAMPADGTIVACDISAEYTSVARRYWAEAGVADRIDLRIAPASESLDALLAEGAAGTFDFAFIDADKTAYPGYYEQCLQLVRKGGLLLLDNMFMKGRVMDPAETDEGVVAVHALNRFIHADQRVDQLLLPFSDGITLALKR